MLLNFRRKHRTPATTIKFSLTFLTASYVVNTERTITQQFWKQGQELYLKFIVLFGLTQKKVKIYSYVGARDGTLRASRC